MKKITLLLILLLSFVGFSQAPLAPNADNNRYVATLQQATNQNSSLETFSTVMDSSVKNHPKLDVALLEGSVQGVTNRGDCITEDFEGYLLPSGSANFLPGVTMLDETTVVNGQGPGLVEDGCVYISLAGDLQWNGVDYYGQENQTIIASSTDGTLTLQYDLTVDAVDFELSAFDGFPDSVTIEALDDSGASLGILGPVAVPESSLVPVSFAVTGIKTIRIVGMYDGVNGFSPLLNNHVFCPDGSAPSNDLCEDAVVVVCNGTYIGDTSIATDTGGNAAPDLWYSFTGTGVEQDITLSLCDDGTDYDTYLRVFDACDGTEIAGNDDFCFTSSELTFTSDGTSTYFIMVEGFLTLSGSFNLAVSCNPDDPESNDDCVSAIDVNCGDTVVGETTTATDSGSNPSPDVFFSFTGEGVMQDITLSLCDGGTDYDSLLRVFDACDGNEIVANDDFCGAQSELTFTSDGTATYIIMVEGFSTSSGNFSLTISCNPDDVELNDTCEEATPVACGDVILGDTSIGTDTGGNLAPDLWYSYTGGGLLEEVTISLCDGGTDYDSLIRVFDACGGGEIAVNDDACGLQSELTFTSDGTSTYFIMVEGFGASSGNFTMSVTCEPLGIDDIDFAGFNYYPNPANETINFSSLEDIDSIAIYNVIGQQVIAQSVHAISGQLNVSNLRTGTYIMEVTIGVKTATYKVIKR
jgi:hypothetical protein